jgi:carboxymethylenebutenolidase
VSPGLLLREARALAPLPGRAPAGPHCRPDIAKDDSFRGHCTTSEPTKATPVLTPEQQVPNDLWEEPIRNVFQTHDPEATIDTLVPHAHVNSVPVMTGGAGSDGLRDYYARLSMLRDFRARLFIPKLPPDADIVPVSRTVGADRLVDEFILGFTHTVEMEWMLPGVPPTGRRVQIPMVVVVHFREGKLAHEHLYWDQASALVRLGLLGPSGLPVAGVETARKVLNPGLPFRELIRWAEARQGAQPKSLRNSSNG